MIAPVAVSLGLLAQIAALPRESAAPRRAADPVTIRLNDSAYTPGARARLFVRVRDAGYLTLVQVDPVGRIRILFPVSPDAPASVPGGRTFEVVVPVDRESGTGTVIAVRARRPFDVAGLRSGSAWDYENALLLQPTAGAPLAALLDIADRIAAGGAYEFDVVTYRTGERLAPPDPQLTRRACLECVRRAPAEQPSIVVNQTFTNSNVVDCSGTVLINSHCGVVDNRVSVTNVYEAPATSPSAPAPYYVPIAVPLRRFAPPPPDPAPAPRQPSAVAGAPSPNVVPSRTLLRTITSRRP